jgi:hypothetical protein
MMFFMFVAMPFLIAKCRQGPARQAGHASA